MGILLCYDASSEEDQMKALRDWMRIIEKSADDDPVVMLVGTKLDKCTSYNGVLNEEYEEVMTRGDEMARELELPCTLTSSRNNINVKAPFVDILHILKNKEKLRRSTFCNNPGTKQYVSNSQPDVVYLHGNKCDNEEGDTLGSARRPGSSHDGDDNGTVKAQGGVGSKKKAFACSMKACSC